MMRAFIASLTVSLLAGCAVAPAGEEGEEDLVAADAAGERQDSSAFLFDCPPETCDKADLTRPDPMPWRSLQDRLAPRPLASRIADVDTAEAEAEAEGAAVAYSSTVTFNAETPFYIPPRVGGDSDFSGNGPSVYLITGLHLVNGNEVWATVHIDATETKSDWTRANGTGWFHLYTAPREITAIFAQPFLQHEYVDTDHARDIFGFPAGYLVSRLEYVGDTKGNEAGSRTGVKVVFQPITVGLL